MKDFLKISKFFLIWRVVLFLIAFLAPFFIKEFGARFPYYSELIASHLPYWIWSFGNFDGVYYLRIAQNGYQDQYSQAFFPLFPLLIKLLTPNGVFLIVGLLLSNLFFLGFLYVFYKLLKLDFSEKISFRSIILLLLFPTSFYLGSVYVESLLLFLIALSIFLFRKKMFLASGLVAALASATKIFGVLLVFYMAIEIYLAVKNREIKLKSWQFFREIVAMCLAPMGLFAYMYYLNVTFRNPLYFLTSQSDFGAQRSSEPFILLPQVLYRYLKILTSVNINSLPYFNSALELLFTLIPLVLLLVFFKKIRFSYWFFSFCCLILPTLTGTLLSMPRFILTNFLLLPIVVVQFNNQLRVIMIFSILLALILVSLYTRGYWVA